MTLLKERGRSDDNDARAFLLSNTAEERVELLWDRRGVDLISDALPFGRPVVWRAERIRFRDQKNHRPPHRRYEGRLFP
jgi:hypothetical protein